MSRNGKIGVKGFGWTHALKLRLQIRVMKSHWCLTLKNVMRLLLDMAHQLYQVFWLQLALLVDRDVASEPFYQLMSGVRKGHVITALDSTA